MTARMMSAFLTLSVLVAACGSAAPAASPMPSAVSSPVATRTAMAPTAAATATPQVTRTPPESVAASQSPVTQPSASSTAAPVSPRPDSSATAGPVVNADGSVWIVQAPGYGALMAGDDAMWMVHHKENVGRDILRVDPATNETEVVVHDEPLYPNPIHGFAVNGSIWMSAWDLSSVIQYDAETGEEIKEHRVGAHPVEPVYAYGDVWTTNIHGNSVSRLDPETTQVQTIEMVPPGAPIGMVIIRDDLALVGNADGLPYLINPETMAVLGQFDAGLGGECLPPIAAIEGKLWVKECNSNELIIMDPDSRETLGRVTSPVVPGLPLYVDDVMWLPRVSDDSSGHWDGQGFVGLDTETYDVVGEYEAPSRFTDGGYAVAFDSLWPTGLEGVLRVPANTLRAAVE